MACDWIHDHACLWITLLSMVWSSPPVCQMTQISLSGWSILLSVSFALLDLWAILVPAFLELVSQVIKMPCCCISVTLYLYVCFSLTYWVFRSMLILPIMALPFSSFWMLVPSKPLFHLTEVSCCDFKHVTLRPKDSGVSLCAFQLVNVVQTDQDVVKCCRLVILFSLRA